MWNRRLLVSLAAALVVLVAACSGNDGRTSATTTAAEPLTRGQELAAQMDCERTEAVDLDDDANNENWGFHEAIDCWLDGSLAIRLHTIDPQRVAFAISILQARYGDAELTKCASGKEFGQFVVAGEDWMAMAASTAIRDYVMNRLGGDSVSDDGGPPVSYTMMDACQDESPPSSG